jgi:hypothetical protein
MSAVLASPSSEEWLTGRTARRQLGGISYASLQRLAVLGRIGTLVEPGIPPRYRRSDVARLAAPGPGPAAAIAG